ncbi:hypothetical protein CP533_1713 [Ophiocordyceps camponoti-saundersi (nom. inval.)]|nr:hypothetical protein CP533_1713 [Ophiocordyceps camponoti-saundersi (nom. inval.)]
MAPTKSSRGGPAAARALPSNIARKVIGGKTVLSKRHRRLARRGGVKRISAGIYDEILQSCVIYVEYRNAKTITTLDVIHSLARLGRPVYGFDPATYNPSKRIKQSRNEVPESP